MTTTSPLQTLANTSALKRAEAQYRLARLFTPYSFRPERVDFERVEAFLDDPRRAFPQPTEAVSGAIARIEASLIESNALLGAFAAQGIEPSLTPDQLFTTAQANVEGQAMNTASYKQVA